MMRAEALLRFATQQPDQHNIREAYKQMYTEMGVDPMKIDLILPDRQTQVKPADPLTENMRAIMKQPVKAGEYQDHDAHIAAHAPIAAESPELQAHINEHLAFKMRIQVQEVIGQPLPPPGEPMPPEIENQIAIAVAQAMQQLAPMYKPQPQQQPDPLVEIEMAKIQQRTQSDALRAQTELQKAEIEYRSDAEDRALKAQIEGVKIATEAQRELGGM